MADDLIECTAHGDAILVIGTGEATRKLKVDTYILKHASEIFRAMFGHQWSDGKGLDYATPKEISFPEDDPEAMESICRILHHTYHKTTSSMDAHKLLSLARTVDKYFLQEVLASMGDVLLRNIMTDDPQTLLDLWHAAFLLQNERMQTLYIKKLVLLHAGDYAMLMRPGTPKELLDLKDALAAARQRLHHDFDLLLLNVFAYGPRSGGASLCDCLAAYNKVLYDYMIDNNIMPDDQGCYSESVHSRVKLMQGFPKPFWNEYAHSGKDGEHKTYRATPVETYMEMRSRLDKILASADTLKIEHYNC